MKDKHKQMYMRIAEAVAETSSGVRLKVGAVAVKNSTVIGTGYNALPSGVNGSLEYKDYDATSFQGGYQLLTRPEVRHSEKNLLLNLAKSTESSVGAVIFCTHSCCKFCAMDILDAGIIKFYYKEQYRSFEGIQYLIDNGVEVERIE